MPETHVPLIFLGSISVILIALPYLNNAFWYKEAGAAVAAAVTYWGDLSYKVGVILLILVSTLLVRSTRPQKVIVLSLLVTILLMQIPQFFRGWVFSGSALTEGPPPGQFKADWLYSIPHLLVLLLTLLSLYVLIRSWPKRHLD